MPYQGNTPAENYAVTVKDSFSGNGAATAFTLSQPTVTNDVRVVVENVVQDPTVAYAVSGTTLTFTSAPVSGTNNIYVIHLGPAVQQVAPPSTISNATTFASNVSVQGLFNSVGIDDNADATAITIDSSETVLVGKTSNTFSQQGVALRANNDSQITRDGGHPLSLNRTSSDGAILKAYKAGTEIGSIGVESGDNLTIGGTTANHSGLLFGTNSIIPMQAGSGSNATQDLGNSGSRFKDLYLSSGVLLGGTGAANRLDDYEEGSWNFTVSSGGVGGAATYTKIGRMVYVTADLTLSGSRGSEGFRVGGLPFPAQRWQPGSFYAQTYTREGTDQVSAAASGGSSNVAFVAFGDEASGNEFGNGYFVFSIWYHID